MARIPPLLQLTDISLTFGGDPVFDGLDLVVQPGDRVALVGRNGSGKSTLMKVMAGLVEPDRGGERILPPGVTTGYMQQHPDLTGFATLGDFAASDLEPGSEYLVERVAEGGLKFKPDTDTATASGGGERRRAALAKLLAEAPELMLLDEPTNHLDIEAITWLERELSTTRAGGFVLISHDRAFLRALTRATLWIDRGGRCVGRRRASRPSKPGATRPGTRRISSATSSTARSNPRPAGRSKASVRGASVTRVACARCMR